MNPTALARYRSVQVTTSSPGEVLLLLYDGLLRFVTEAAEAMKRSDRARAGERISRAHAILEELAATLDNKSAPELCDRLMGIYNFCMGRLLEANLAQDPGKLVEVDRILRPLAEAWRQAVRKG